MYCYKCSSDYYGINCSCEKGSSNNDFDYLNFNKPKIIEPKIPNKYDLPIMPRLKPPKPVSGFDYKSSIGSYKPKVIERKTCWHCSGRKFVPVAMGGPMNGPGGPVPVGGHTCCPHCLGSGYERGF